MSYVAYGPIFATTTKATPDPVVGLDGLRAAARRAAAAGLPLVAIGGITLDTAPAVIAAGARAVAVIGDLVNGGEPPEARARRFVVALAQPTDRICRALAVPAARQRQPRVQRHGGG